MLSPRALSLAITAVTLALAYGIWYSYSVILVALLQEYGWSRSVLAGAFSVFTLVHGSANPLIGALCDRLRPLVLMAVGGAALGVALFLDSFIASPWHLYAAFGFVTAITVAAAGWVPSLVQVQRDFQDKLGFAVGLLSSGVGIGMTFVVPLTQFLIDAYGWRTAFRVLAAICALWIVPSSLYLLRVRNRGQSPINLAHTDAAPDPRARTRKPLYNATLKEAWRHEPFWLMLGAFFFGNVCSQTLHVHQVAYLVDNGVSTTMAASVVGLVGASSIVGKIGGGWLADRLERELVYICGIAIMLAAVAALAMIGPQPPAWAIYGYAVLLGVGYSATAAITPSMISDRFGGPNFGSIIGALLIGSSAGSAVGPWMAGFIFDHTGSYMLAFAIAATTGIVTAAAGWRAWMLRRRA